MKTRHISYNLSQTCRIACLLLLSGLLLLPAIGNAMIKEHTVQIDFNFDCQAIPDKTVVGYRLYKEGVLACESDASVENSLNCNITTPTGKFAFTLVALYNDGSTSMESAPFLFTVVDETSPILGLLALAGQSPEDISGLGEMVGESTIDLADIIHLLRQENPSAL
ncbi:hypothetical protein KQH41_00300 [bacterium]|nr:hypothetical protein [bacterium]